MLKVRVAHCIKSCLKGICLWIEGEGYGMEVGYLRSFNNGSNC